MSSTNKTPLGLNQWVGTDNPKREDFNSDNTIIDGALANKVNKTGDTISAAILNINNDSTYQSFELKRSGVTAGSVFTDAQNKSLVFRVYDGTGANYKALLFYNSGIIFPSPDKSIDLGSSSNRFKNIYAETGTINTSDEREKKDISTLDKIKSFFMALNPVKFRFKDGTSGRIHHGLNAREVETAMTENGLSDLDFAGLIKSPEKDENGNETGNIIYGLRYIEFIPMLIKMVQDQQRRIEALEDAQ